MLKMKVLGAAALVVAGLVFAGCKTAPELTQANALALVQASYDKAAAQPISITLGKDGLTAGITAKYWALSKIYPNRFWADYTLTPEGKKAVKLEGKGEIIEWRPDHFGDDAHTQALAAVATAKLKAKEASAPVKTGETLTMAFVEALNLEGVPQGVQDLLHQPGNKLSSKRTATFALVNGAWALQSVK